MGSAERARAVRHHVILRPEGQERTAWYDRSVRPASEAGGGHRLDRPACLRQGRLNHGHRAHPRRHVDAVGGRSHHQSLSAQGGGAIINISTFAAFEPDPLFPTSGIFRAGLAGFVKLYADKYAAQNIRMNNVLPGFIDSLPETEERRARIPLGRYGKEDEVSSLIGWLASEGGGYVTGQNWRIDGGLTRGV